MNPEIMKQINSMGIEEICKYFGFWIYQSVPRSYFEIEPNYVIIHNFLRYEYAEEISELDDKNNLNLLFHYMSSDIIRGIISSNFNFESSNQQSMKIKFISKSEIIDLHNDKCKLVIVIYMNKEWRRCWGGSYELLNNNGLIIKTQEVDFNCAIVFKGDIFHGITNPIKCPNGYKQKLLYFTYN